ncbi:glycoside hydrolase family 13 protein [Paracidobacterium acidisoli]|uniref:Alpha-glucosidase n=1 Tax=Paracidobacterium acidisoli TaxID=2303751 RepID=A0A372ILP0_9BACT|nr:alpha-glucosidase [Paracidobacterium acidisoli]MBT9332488.1 alpha-glucosidase [Paracidobacterium acidisoli]
MRQQGWRSKRTLATVALSALLAISAFAQVSAFAQQTSTAGQNTGGHPWWKGAVLYEVYPRSFQDSNGDGIGDLNGIASRLGYLQSLGVDAIWLSPIYPSPQVDFGYDISNYEAIDPQYGTMADFDHLMAEAKKHNIRVIMDMVLNHTSDKHPWFIESRSSKENPKRDWYMWHDPGPNGGPPNNWQSDFGHSAWELDRKTGQYYYHKFYIQQPDLNWNNPEVRKAMYDVVRFWVDRGVAGFRLDAITTLFEDPKLTNEKEIPGKDGKPMINAYGDVTLAETETNNLPEVHDVLRELRKVTDSYQGRQVVLIGETYLSSIADLRKMYGLHNDELQLPMDMQVGFINRLDVSLFRRRINEAETELNGNEPLFVFDNHDNARWDRYGDGVHNKDIGRMLAAILFASRDTALMYYGDEIGMVTTPPKTKAEVRDPVGITGWPKNKGRDGERTPMQWTAGPNAGFSGAGGKTWLPIPPSYRTINVAAESDESDSILHWYEELIALKKSNTALREGDETMLNTTDAHVLSWLRRAPGGEAVVVACNFTAQPQTIGFDLKAHGVAGEGVKTLLKTPGGADPVSLNSVTLPPFGVYIGQVE